MRELNLAEENTQNIKLQFSEELPVSGTLRK